MSHTKAYLMILLAVIAFSVSCSSRQYTTLNEPEPASKQAEKAEETQNNETVTQEVQEQDKPDSVEIFLNKTTNEVALLRKEGERLVEEKDLEEARKAYDEALDVILSSGLALDAHPELSTLLKKLLKKLSRLRTKSPRSRTK